MSNRRAEGVEESKGLVPGRLTPLQVPSSPGMRSTKSPGILKGVRTPGGLHSAGMSLRTPGGGHLSPTLGREVSGSFAHSMLRGDSRGAVPYGTAWDREEFTEVLFPPRSPAMSTVSNTVPKPVESRETAKLFAMSYQSAFAARTIQKYWRGWYVRYSLWKWDGVMLNSRALKIQRTWRGRQGRKLGLQRARQRLANFANLIKGRYFVWLAKKKLRVLKAEQVAKQVVMIQCLYRTRLARRLMALVRFRHHTKMAIRVQSLARGRHGRRRYRGMKARLNAVFQRMSAVMRDDVAKSQARIRPSLESLAGHTDRSCPWELLETAMFHMIGTIRRDISLDLTAELTLKHPAFPFGRFALQVALFLTFTCSGSTNHVRMDMLDELVGCLYYGQKVIGSDKDFNDHRLSSRHVRPEMSRSDPTSRFGWEDPRSGVMDELEFVYFRNSFKRHGKSAHSMTVMAACALMRMSVRDWDVSRTAEQTRLLVRARHLLVHASERNTNNIEEALSRIEVMENIFGKAHRVLLQRTIVFDGLAMLGYKAFNLLHQSHRRSLKDKIGLSIEVVRCGEIVIVRGTLLPLPMSLEAVQKARKFNNIPPFSVDSETGQAEGVEMAEKWTTYARPYEERVEEFQAAARAAEASKALEEEDGDDEGILPHFHAADASNASEGGECFENESLGTIDNSVGTLGTEDGNSLTSPRADDDSTQSSPPREAHTEHSPKAKGRKSVRRREEKPEDHPYLPALVVRPMVLLHRECLDMTEIATKHAMKERGVSEEELQNEGIKNVLAEYLANAVRVSTCRSRLVHSHDGAQMASLKVTLPQLEYRRLEQNNARTVDFSVKLIQRIYRGSRGKHRFRRIWFRAREKKRQHENLTAKIVAAKKIRDERCFALCKVQASIKAWSWRRLMKRMRRAATLFQCMVRCFIARARVDEERRRQTMGPEIHEMARKAVEVGDLKFTMIVYRCGAQYKLLGYDHLQINIYEGIVLQDEVVKLVEDFNKALTGTALQIERQRISPQSIHRVTELILRNVGVAGAMPAATTNLGALPESSVQKRYILVLKPFANADVPGLTNIRNLGRALKDTQGVVEQYEKLMVKQARQRAQGLLAPDKGIAIKKKPSLKSLGMK